MDRLKRLLDARKTVRAIGFDDGPYPDRRGARTVLVGAVTRGVRFEGMVFGRVRRDGWNATREICRLLLGGKFLPQLHIVLLDGIAMAGLNLIDLPRLHAELGKPCVAVMRRLPDLPAVIRAIRRLPRSESRLRLLERAGPIHSHGRFHFQVQGGDPEAVGEVLERLTDTGHVPEALRLAHLIGSACIKGESGRRA